MSSLDFRATAVAAVALAAATLAASAHATPVAPPHAASLAVAASESLLEPMRVWASGKTGV